MTIEEIKRKKGNKPVVYKSLALAFKVDSESRTVSGYLAAFGNVDSDGDMLIQGCFTKSLQERGVGSKTARKIAYLWQHDMREPIGKFTKLEEDSTGLYFEAVLDKVPRGDQALTQYQSGTLNQHSIGYKYLWDKVELDDQNNCLIVKELDLFEGSVVTLGANENTPFTGMKAADIESQRNQLDRDIETSLKGLDYDKQYQLRQLIARAISLAETEPEPNHSKEVSKPGTDWSKVAEALNKK